MLTCLVLLPRLSRRPRACVPRAGAGGAEPFEVESCFGGLAVYRYSALRGCAYDHRRPDPPHALDCEHAVYHDCLRARARARGEKLVVLANPRL